MGNNDDLVIAFEYFNNELLKISGKLLYLSSLLTVFYVELNSRS